MEERLKIATHDSMSGEPSMWFSIPLIPFARTQSKTIYQQWQAGCRMFDLRAKFVCGKWRGAHGLWYSKTGLEETLELLNTLSNPTSDPIEIALTYEGRSKSSEEFLIKAEVWKAKYTNLVWGVISAKYSDNSIKVNYDILIPADKNAHGGIQSFLPLDGNHWQTFLPIPWLWKQFYFKNVEFNTKQFQFVDFL